MNAKEGTSYQSIPISQCLHINMNLILFDFNFQQDYVALQKDVLVGWLAVAIITIR